MQNLYSRVRVGCCAFLLSACALMAQAPGQFVPIVPTSTVPAATGSPVVTTLIGVNPQPLTLCGTYNIILLNWQTGDEYTCVLGYLTPNPQRLRTGTANNTDLAGKITLVAGAGSYTFTGVFATAPVCTATDTTAAAAVQAATSTTALTLTGTGTDVIAYTCVART